MEILPWRIRFLRYNIKLNASTITNMIIEIINTIIIKIAVTSEAAIVSD